MRKSKPYDEEKIALVNRTRIKVRFSETDAMGVVWHGNYIKFFEDGREAFGQEFGLEYLLIYESGFTAPIVDVGCQYKHSLTFGEEVIIETGYVPCAAAKIQFIYKILRASDEQIMAQGHTVQVFLNSSKELELLNPKFYKEWKGRWNL